MYQKANKSMVFIGCSNLIATIGMSNDNEDTY